MDYRRIQITLIVTFFVLNLYLVTVLLQKNQELNFGDQSAAVNLEEGLRNDNIDSPPLSEEQRQIPIIKVDKNNFLMENMSTLSNQTTRMEDNRLLGTLSNPVELDMSGSGEIASHLAPLEEFMNSGNILKAEEYVFLSYQPTNQQIVYLQDVNGIPIADGTGSLIFHLNADGEVISYAQTYSGEAEVQGKNRTVISQQAAIESLYLNNQIPSDSTLRNLTLSYFQTLSLSDMNIYSPMWYVEIIRETGTSIQVKRIDALTGNVITNQPIINPEDEDATTGSAQDAEAMLNQSFILDSGSNNRQVIVE